MKRTKRNKPNGREASDVALAFEVLVALSEELGARVSETKERLRTLGNLAGDLADEREATYVRKRDRGYGPSDEDLDLADRLRAIRCVADATVEGVGPAFSSRMPIEVLAVALNRVGLGITAEVPWEGFRNGLADKFDTAINWILEDGRWKLRNVPWSFFMRHEYADRKKAERDLPPGVVKARAEMEKERVHKERARRRRAVCRTRSAAFL